MVNTRIAVNSALTCALVLHFCIWFYAAGQDIASCAKQIQSVSIHVQSVPPAARQGALTAVVVAAAHCPALEQQTVRLGWYASAPLPAVGEVLQVQVKLRRPWGGVNPGGFNYRLWLLSRGVYASGYVRDAAPTPAAVRQTGSMLLHDHLLRALAIGQRDGVSAEQWALFKRTGTIHLMVVSGLHVGLLATLVGGIGYGLSRCVGFAVGSLTPRIAGLLVGAVTALAYAWVAQLAVPVVRAALMLLAATALVVLGRRTSVLAILLVTGLGSALLMPQILLQQGFWLSYLAVLCLALVFGFRLRRFSWMTNLLLVQGGLFIGMTPWLGVIMGEVPVLTPLVNLLVVPLMSLITIPAAMLGHALRAVTAGEVNVLLLLADFSMHVVLRLLRQFPEWSTGYFDSWRVAVAAALFVGLCLPLQASLRQGLLACWFCLLLQPDRQPLPGTVRITFLDVGQGSAAIVDTHRHRLVVDTGARFASGFDSAEAVVIPALRRTGADQVDAILISHFDNDHAGGLPALQSRYPSARLTAPELGCIAGTRWRWDGVEFRVLNFAAGRSRNDQSCTLLIVDRAGRSAYLAGDIGTQAELRLLRELPANIDVLLAPHHGSASSSHRALIAHLQPQWVVFSAGRDNHYGHPHPKVVARYRAAGAYNLVTAETGALVWHSQSDTIDQYRSRLGGMYLPLVSKLDQ